MALSAIRNDQKRMVSFHVDIEVEVERKATSSYCVMPQP